MHIHTVYITIGTILIIHFRTPVVYDFVEAQQCLVLP